VGASFVSEKEFTVALKLAVIVADLVVIVVPVEGQFKFGEPKSGAVFSVSLCFFHLANQAIIHLKLLLS
jgi:hypothetical protein